MSIGFVCLMGMGTVFVGLICIIILCKIASAVVNASGKKTESTAVEQAAPVSETGTQVVSADRQQILAAVCAVIAEELGTDVSALKVLSFKKL